MPVIKWVCLPISFGLYLPSTGYYLPTRRGLYLSPTEYTYLPDVGYTCHQLGILTRRGLYLLPTGYYLPTRCGLYLSPTGYTYQTWAIPVTNWVYLPTRCGLYLSPTEYTYLQDVGYTCHQLGITYLPDVGYTCHQLGILTRRGLYPLPTGCEQVLFVRFYNNPAPLNGSMQFHYCTLVTREPEQTTLLF